MELAQLSDRKIIDTAICLVKEEKNLTAQVLKYLQEVDRRRLYATYSLPSLFSFCVQVLNYSEAEASIRVGAMRLMRSSKLAEKKIEQGQLSLTNASRLQRAFNQESKLKKEIQENIINEASGKTTREVERILVKKLKDFKNENSYIKLTINGRILKKLIKIQEHFDDCSELEAIEALLDEKIIKIEAEKKAKGQDKDKRNISRALKEKIYVRARGQCEYKSVTGKRCPARAALQIDHIKPFCHGGKTEERNLRLLCPSHNQYFAIKKIGLGHMDRYLSPNSS